MAVDIQWVNFDVLPGAGAPASAMKRDSSGVDFALVAGAYVGAFLDSLNPGGLAAMDVVVPPGAAIKIQMYVYGSAQVIAPTTLGGGTYSGSQLTMTASGTPTWDIPPGRALGCYCVSATGGTFHLSPLRLASAPVGTPYWWGPATLGGTASLPSPVTADPRGFWPLPATAGLTLIGTRAWTGAKTFTVPFYRTGAGTINAKITATTGTATLVTADGATVNGDGSLTIPADTHLFPSWTATDGATLTLTKGAGFGSAFYGPLYLDETAPPIIVKLIPAAGPDTGGTLVDIVGTDLTGATGVDFGGAPGTGLTVDPSGGLATVSSPAHTAGPYPVTITTPAGTSNAATFLFTPPGAPTLTGIDPTEGPETGGTTALLTGTNLAGTIGVDFGGSPATIITTTTTAILVTTPAHAAGTVNVTATTTDGTTDPLAFEFAEATGPVIDGPDVIANLVALLTSELGVPVSSRRSPTATKDSDPSVVVRRTGGPSKGVASDNPTITIEAWAPTTTESFQLLQSARMVVIEAAEQGRAGLRRYDEFAGPADLPDPSTTNPRHTLTASVVTRLE